VGACTFCNRCSSEVTSAITNLGPQGGTAVTKVMSKPQGPNIKRLICEKMSAIAVPPGGGLKDALQFLQSKDSIIAAAKEATRFVELAIQAVREAPQPNRFALADDEEIAGEILRQVHEKRKQRILGTGT